jgi:SAM-dependent methyltransferase
VPADRPLNVYSSRWRSYSDVDAAGDPESLGRQLDLIASVPFMASEKARSLALLGLPPGASVLDVGCGPGPELAGLAEIVGPGGRVVGLDRSEALLEVARERELPGQVPTELVLGDAGALPFGDGEFDACRADRTLQHLVDPVRALEEMVRVTRPSRRVVVTESRWGLVAPSLHAGMTDAILELTATGSEQAGWVGYRLPAMFEQVGLSDVRSISSDHTVCEHDDFFGFTHLHASAEHAARAGVVTPEQAESWVALLTDLVGRGEAFAMVIVLHVVGARPAG